MKKTGFFFLLFTLALFVGAPLVLAGAPPDNPPATVPVTKAVYPNIIGTWKGAVTVTNAETVKAQMSLTIKITERDSSGKFFRGWVLPGSDPKQLLSGFIGDDNHFRAVAEDVLIAGSLEFPPSGNPYLKGSVQSTDTGDSFAGAFQVTKTTK